MMGDLCYLFYCEVEFISVGLIKMVSLNVQWDKVILINSQQMKNYGNVNQQAKVKQLNTKTVLAKTKLLPKGATLSTKLSTKTIGSSTTTLQQCKKPSLALMTRSAKQITRHVQIQNQELTQMDMLGLHDGQELFGQTTSKLKNQRLQPTDQSIEEDLAQVLGLIKLQKMQAEEQIKILKREHENYRRICEGYNSLKVQCGVNTLPSGHNGGETMVRKEAGVGCAFPDKSGAKFKLEQTDSSDQEIGARAHETYMKLQKVLEDIEVDPQRVLPSEGELRGQMSLEEPLTEKRMIRIQKYFIQRIMQQTLR